MRPSFHPVAPLSCRGLASRLGSAAFKTQTGRPTPNLGVGIGVVASVCGYLAIEAGAAAGCAGHALQLP